LVEKFLCNAAKQQTNETTDKQTDADEIITFLVEAINISY